MILFFSTQEEEAEWCGLTTSEAIEKQRRIEAKQNPMRSLRDIYTEELVNKLRGNNEEDQTDLNCFAVSLMYGGVCVCGCEEMLTLKFEVTNEWID